MSEKQSPFPSAFSQPPAPQGYGQPSPPPAYPGSTTVVVTQPGLVNPQVFRNFGVQMQCPHCQATVTTSTRYEAGTLTWIACCVTAAVGCWLGCCFIPFCIDDCKDVIHTCPSCHQTVGRYNRL